MDIKIENVEQIGRIARVVRKKQGMDQASMGMFSGNGTTFMGDFENGKTSVELGRVFNVLKSLGVTVTLDIPMNVTELSAKEVSQLLVNAEADHHEG